MEGITGQNIDWVQQVLVGRLRAGLVDRSQLPRVILRFNLQVVPFFDDLFKSLNGSLIGPAGVIECVHASLSRDVCRITRKT